MSTATTPSKSYGGSAAIAWADISSGAQSISSVIDVSTVHAIEFFIRLARRSGSAFTAGWPNVRIEASGKSSGNDSWVPLWTYQMMVGASIANTTLNGAVSAAATTFTVTSATNISVGDVLYLGDTSTANWELVRVKGVSGTTITPEDAVTYAHANSAAVTDQAEMVSPVLGCQTYKRLRVVVDNAGSGQTMAAEVLYSTLDNYTTA